jgi:hypothetical protein
MSTLTPRVIWTVTVDPADSQIVYAGSNEDDVWKSSDAGGSWSPITSAYQLPAIYALTVIPVEDSPSIVFAGTAGAGICKMLRVRRARTRRLRAVSHVRDRPRAPGPVRAGDAESMGARETRSRACRGLDKNQNPRRPERDSQSTNFFSVSLLGIPTICERLTPRGGRDIGI